MRQFAEAAVVHAQQRHGLTLEITPLGVPAAERILDAQRERGDAAEFDSLALCYGSWLGEVAVQHFAAQWVGMHEPHPPRLQVAGVLCSPIEAVARRLQSSAEPPLGRRLQELAAWVADLHAAEAARERNRRAWDELACEPKFVQTEGINELLMDPETAEAALDPWLRDLPRPGSTLLCLAAGGGTHSVLYALAGFRVTVVDISPRMLAVDQQLAAAYRSAPVSFRHGHEVHVATLLTSMDDLSALEDASFDCVLQPVSACYLPDPLPVYAEVARVLRDGGRYVVQHKQPASLQASGTASNDGYRVVHPAFSGRLASSSASSERHLERETLEFIHPLDTLVGGLCRSGFVIEDFQEPPRADAWAAVGSDQHRACFLPPYLKIKARRLNRNRQPQG
ncbi:MAG: methyltransferase domain-containing protein [Pirellulaceae bacterium]|nr:methyltransferase domain-containing protein [Pirellulaceae bacterium]